MKVETFLTFTSEEVRKNIPFAIVCETMSGRYWNTSKRKRLMKQRFTEAEIEATYRLHAQARNWYLVKGVPDTVKMTANTLALWHKLAQFCCEL